jgi:leucyl aminopeptidase
MEAQKNKRAVVVLSGTREFKTLNTKSGGQLGRALDDVEKDKGVTVSYPNKVDADFVRVETRRITDAQSAREFGGEVYHMFKSQADVLEFRVATKFNIDIRDGVDLAKYQFLSYKSEGKPHRCQTIEIDARGGGIAESINLARDVITEPGNVLYPAEYARRIERTLSPLGVTVKVYHQEQLKEMGFNLLLSVGQGSSRDSYVVVMEWMRGAKNERPVALVGKGVTFDTGGISIKPSKNMHEMKYDMSGSAAVFGTMHAIARANLAKNVVGIVGLVENMPDGSSVKPGDIVKSLSDKTVENLNTDAEGRLVLADVLTHVQNEYDPAVIVDLATLTGAIMVTLGSEMAGLFTNSTGLAESLIQAGKSAGEDYFRMPMGERWNKMIDSDIADMQNIGGPYGGSTTAAEFLYRFVDSSRAWAHLDIAGMAWEDSGRATVPKGAVGFGIGTLFNLVADGRVRGLTVDEDMKY